MFGGDRRVGELVKASRVLLNPTLKHIEVTPARRTVNADGSPRALRTFRVVRVVRGRLSTEVINELIDQGSFGGSIDASYCELVET